jgi:hypothetical protein
VTLTAPGPELVVDGTFSVGTVPRQFSGTNCLLGINANRLAANVSIALGTVTIVASDVITVTAPTVYRISFDYLATNASVQYLNVSISDQSNTYYTTASNLNGTGTFVTYVQFPATSTQFTMVFTPTTLTTGSTNGSIPAGTVYMLDNVSVRKYI